MFIWTAVSHSHTTYLALTIELLFGLAFTHSIPPILGNRFVLGFTEATFGPCLLAITVQWYKRSEQPFVTAIWQSMSALATSIASLYGWGFYQVPEASGLKGWQWVILALAIGSFISSSK
jgi:MFS family permease